MKFERLWMGATSVLFVSLACGCVADAGTDDNAKPEAMGRDQSALIYCNPPGYNPPGTF